MGGVRSIYSTVTQTHTHAYRITRSVSHILFRLDDEEVTGDQVSAQQYLRSDLTLQYLAFTTSHHAFFTHYWSRFRHHILSL